MQPALLSVDKTVLAAANDFPFCLFHPKFGSPDRSTCQAIASSTGIDFVDVWTSLKLLKRTGYLDDFGPTTSKPVVASTPKGVYSLTDILNGRDSVTHVSALTRTSLDDLIEI